MAARSALAFLLIAAPATAQEIRGTVVDSNSGRGLPSAVVLVINDSGRVFHRTITDELGRYRLPLRAEATRARVIRMGFRPREMIVPASRPDVVTFDVAMTSLPRMLEAVRALANPLCPRRANRDGAFGLWQQAQTGLLAMIVAREANPAPSKLLVFERQMAGNSDVITGQRVHLDSGTWAKPFTASRSVADFGRAGFVRVGPDGRRQYFGPDAEVLLSDEFQARYCISVEPRDRARPSQIGLRFEPAVRATHRVDIAGVFWVDTATRSLRDIDFRYLGLEAGVDRYRPGGYVGFRDMPNGIVLVDRWSLRMVSLLVDTTRRTSLERGGSPGAWGGMDPVEQRRFVVTEAGGELIRADWPTGASWRASLGAVRISAVSPDGKPAAGVRVALDSTGYGGITDSAGVLVIHDLLPGPYTAVVVDSALAVVNLRVDAGVKFVAARDSTHRATFVAYSAADVLARACGDRSYAGGYHVFVGLVTTPVGLPAAGVEWRVVERLGLPRADANVLRKGITAADGRLMPCVRGVDGGAVALEFYTRSPPFNVSPHTVTVRLANPATALRIQLPSSR